MFKPHGSSDEPFMDSWEKWHLIPTTRPVIAPAPVKTNYVEIPGANDAIDLTEFPRGFPLYGQRSGSLEFYVSNDYQGYSWEKIYTSISQYLHGINLDVVLKDEEAYYYTGRIAVDSWKSDKSMSTISLKYVFAPYKISRQSMLDDWEWNPFDFDNDLIPDVIQAHFKDLPATSTLTSDTFTSEMMGCMPVTPKLVRGSSYSGDAGMTLKIRNNVPQGIAADAQTDVYPYRTITVAFSDSTPVFDSPEVMLAVTRPDLACQVQYQKTSGSDFTFSFDFHQGRL